MKYKTVFPNYKINREPNLNRMKSENIILWEIISNEMECSKNPLNYNHLLEALIKQNKSKFMSKSFILNCVNNGWLYEVE